jgi:hypothetical protein
MSSYSTSQLHLLGLNTHILLWRIFRASETKKSLATDHRVEGALKGAKIAILVPGVGRTTLLPKARADGQMLLQTIA